MALAFGALGCELSLTPSIAPTVDTTGKFGFETRVDATMGVGDSDHWVVYTGGGPGAGYHQRLGGYFLHTAELGAQFGGVQKKPLVRGRAGIVATPRIGSEGFYPGFGGVVDVLVGVAHTKRPAGFGIRGGWGRILLGGRFQGECLCFQPELEDGTRPPPVGLLSHAFVMQWVIAHEPSMFDARDEPVEEPRDQPLVPIPDDAPQETPEEAPE